MSDREKKEFSKAYRKLRKEVNELEKSYKKARKKHKPKCAAYKSEIKTLEKAVKKVKRKKKECAKKYTKRKVAYLKARRKLNDMLQKASEKIQQQSKPHAAPASSVQTATTPDQLRQINGIGPKIEQLLHEAGIHTFAQLADAKVDQLREILKSAGSRFTMHNPESWPKQAQGI